jgi:hypothetical protein
MIEVLGCLWDSRFSLHGFLQGADRGVRGNFQREEVGILVRGSRNIERDAPSKVGRSVKSAGRRGKGLYKHDAGNEACGRELGGGGDLSSFRRGEKQNQKKEVVMEEIITQKVT